MPRQSALRLGEDTVAERCGQCGALAERYTEAELSLALVILNTFVHRDCQLAAPLLPEILLVVTRIAARPLYSWEQQDALTVIPGNPRSVARQFLRVSLQQLSHNGVFPLLFQIDLQQQQRSQFYSTIVSCLTDFPDLSPTVPVQLFLENIDTVKQSMEVTLSTSLPNLISFLSYIQFDHVTAWAGVFGPLEQFFRQLSLLTLSQDGKPEREPGNSGGSLANIEPVLKLAVYTMKMVGVANHRSILEPVCKVLLLQLQYVCTILCQVVGFAIQFCTFQFSDLMDLCHHCNKGFVKERDKSAVTRTVIAKFIDALKYKNSIPDVNFLSLAGMLLQEARGELPPNSILEDCRPAGPAHTGSTPWLEQVIHSIMDTSNSAHV